MLTTGFVRSCFSELEDQHFDFSSLRSLKLVISEENLSTLRSQVADMKSLPTHVRGELPCLEFLADFVRLVDQLKALMVKSARQTPLDFRSPINAGVNDDPSTR